MANGNGTGKGGKNFQDRELAASVRSLALREIKKVLKDEGEYKDDKEFKKAVLLKLSTSILPRLNEHTGEGGEAINITFDNAFTSAPKKNSEK